MPQPSLAQTIAGAVVSDAIALAVAFGAPLTQIQQTAILGFVGTVTSAIVLGVAYLHGKHQTGAAAAQQQTH